MPANAFTVRDKLKLCKVHHMKNSILFGGLAAALALAALTAPSAASASCNDRKATGTVIGGIGGALIGNSISHGGGGAIVGGLGGAVIGHEVAGRGCGRYRSSSYYDRSSPRYRHSNGYYADTAAQPRYAGDRGYYADTAAQPRYARTVYYDQRGNPVADGYGQNANYAPSGYGTGVACRTVMQSYYDSRGELSQRPVQTCSR